MNNTAIRLTQTGYIGMTEQVLSQTVSVDPNDWNVYVDGEILTVSNGRPPENRMVDLLTFAISRKPKLNETFHNDIISDKGKLPVVFLAHEKEVIAYGVFAGIHIGTHGVANRLECALSRMSGRKVFVEIIGEWRSYA